MIKLKKRLEAALAYVKGYPVLIDIGTDHAKLPVAAVALGYVERAIAVDNKEGPLQNAKQNIIDLGYKGRVMVIRGDGFPSGITFDVATILGLGGITIRDILAKADLKSARRLVLSPQSEAATLRGWLMGNGYKITNETFLMEQEKAYEIIVSEKGTMFLNDLELEFGPLIIKEKNPAFCKYLSKLIRIYEEALIKTVSIEEQNKLNKRIKNLKGLIG